MKVGVVLLAGGTGARFGSDIPKQFVPLNGKPIWEHAFDTFKSHKEIGSIVIVFPENRIPEDTNTLNVAIAGKTRRESVLNGLKALKEVWGECEYVLIHDAARPLVSHGIISQCIHALKTYDAVDVSILSADTIIQVDPSGETVDLVTDRRRMRLGQTPQGFRLGQILYAHDGVEKASRGRDLGFTDDIGILRGSFPNVKIANVEGEERNMKVTTQADLIKAERMARDIPEVPVHLAVGNALIYGGTGGIGSEVVKLLRDNPCPITMIWGTKECDIKGRQDEVWKIQKELLDYVVISVGSFKKVDWFDWGIWKEEFDTNFTHITRFLYNLDARQALRKGCSIVIIGSSSAYKGRGGYTAYSSAKAALVNYVQGLAQEWKDVKINIVNPGRCRTKMREDMFGKEPQDSLISPEDVALKVVKVLGMDCSGCVFDVRANNVDA